jgi:hypothetical protein
MRLLLQIPLVSNVPQPAVEMYSVGDQVQVYVGPDDADAQYHGVVYEITTVFADSLDVETGRSTDSYSYTLRDVATAEELPVMFRHRDLVPVGPDSELIR